MADINFASAYTTNAGASASSALGASSVKADTLLVIGHKAAKTENSGTVYIGFGTVKIPVEPGDILSIDGINDKDMTLDQFTVENVTAGDGLGYVAVNQDEQSQIGSAY